MIEEKHCVNCKFMELDCSLPPCDTCRTHRNWEPREND